MESALGMPLRSAKSLSKGETPVAPGLLKSHYAPVIPLEVGDMDALLLKHAGKRVGVISFKKKYSGVPENLQMTLSAGGDLNEAAQHLFAAMRRLDQLKPDRILAEMFPNEGLGPAINDRLMRAAAKSD
jgi:L-threonylcarbamoyladenylate synthase